MGGGGGEGGSGWKESQQEKKNQARKKQTLLKKATYHSITLFMVKSGRLPTMWSITRRPGSGLKSGKQIATIALPVIFVCHSLSDDQSLNSMGRCNTMSPALGNGSVSMIKLKLCQKMMIVIFLLREAFGYILHPLKMCLRTAPSA